MTHGFLICLQEFIAPVLDPKVVKLSPGDLTQGPRTLVLVPDPSLIIRDLSGGGEQPYLVGLIQGRPTFQKQWTGDPINKALLC